MSTIYDKREGDKELLKTIADFMGWIPHPEYEGVYWVDPHVKREKGERGFYNDNHGTCACLAPLRQDWCDTFDPLNDWNSWKYVEKKIMEDADLASDVAFEVVYHNPHSISRTTDMVTHWMKADRRTLCTSLVTVLESRGR